MARGSRLLMVLFFFLILVRSSVHREQRFILRGISREQSTVSLCAPCGAHIKISGYQSTSSICTPWGPHSNVARKLSHRFSSNTPVYTSMLRPYALVAYGVLTQIKFKTYKVDTTQIVETPPPRA